MVTTFAASTKNELARVVGDRACCRLAELAALIRACGSLEISSNHRFSLNLVTENAAVARKAFTLIKEQPGLEVEVRVAKKVRLKKNNVYTVRISNLPDAGAMLKNLGMLEGTGGFAQGLPSRFLRKECCRRAYLRGSFLGAGSVNSPAGEYHLEIACTAPEQAGGLAGLMTRLGLKALVFKRKDRHVVCLKDAESIAVFLNLAGAHEALLQFENMRILKNVKSEVNRIVNCETGNLGKTVNASLRQMEKVKYLDSVLGLRHLPPALKSVAFSRLANPDATLQELGESVQPGLSKSCVNHRLRRLEQLADELGFTHLFGDASTEPFALKNRKGETGKRYPSGG